MSTLSTHETYKLLKRQLKELISVGNLISKHTSPSALFEGHSWTVLKLIFLKLYVEKIYVPIIRKRYTNMFYVDLFAGSGLDQFEQYKDALIPGSPLISCIFPERGFDHLYLVEKYGEFAEALRERMEFAYLPEKFSLFNCDANKIYTKIIEEIEENSRAHFLAFIDPYAFEIEWLTLERLLKSKVRGDFIILFQANRIAQNVGGVLSGRIKNPRVLNAFFGDTVWIRFVQERRKKGEKITDAVLEYYTKKVTCSKRRESVVERIKVPLFRKPRCYFLIFVTNKTIRNNPWMEKVIELKELIEKGDQELVDSIISELLGKPKSILSYMDSEED